MSMGNGTIYTSFELLYSFTVFLFLVFEQLLRTEKNVEKIYYSFRLLEIMLKASSVC